MAKYNQLIDVATGRLIKNFFSNQPAETPSFMFGDVVKTSITPVEVNTGSDNAERPWRLLDMTGKTIRIAIGDSNRAPSAGEWQVLASDLMPYDATAAQVETALNADATIAAEGGVTVTSEAGSNVYTVLYNTVGTKTDLTEGANTLIPTSDFYAVTIREGDGSTQKVVSIRIETSVSAYSELTDNIVSPTVSVTTVREGGSGVGDVQRVLTTSQAVSGTYALTIDGDGAGEIAFNADVTSIVEAIAAHPLIGGDTSLLSVVGSAADFTVTFDSTLGNIGTIAVDDSNLTGLNGKTGDVNLNTVEMAQLLGSSSSVSAFYEIELLDNGETVGETIHQSSIVVRQDVKPSTPPNTTDLPQYAPLVHTHTISQVVGLQGELDNRIEHDGNGVVSEVTEFSGELKATGNDFSDTDHVVNIGQADERFTRKKGKTSVDASSSSAGVVTMPLTDIFRDSAHLNGCAEFLVHGPYGAGANIKNVLKVTCIFDNSSGDPVNFRTATQDVLSNAAEVDVVAAATTGGIEFTISVASVSSRTYFVECINSSNNQV